MRTEGTLTCLFWNYNCKRDDKEALVARVADHYGVDLLVLAESSAKPESVLQHLKKTDPSFEVSIGLNLRFQVFCRFPGNCLTDSLSTDRLSLRKLRLPKFQEIILGLIHFHDRRNHDRDEQHSRCGENVRAIIQAEQDAGHSRTIIFGDFNMNPFDKGMVDSINGFGAMMSRELALRQSSDGAPRFYNPSWSRFAPANSHPPGTYYWEESNRPFNIFWHSLDQVLVRPALFDAFRDESFQVLGSLPGEGLEKMDLIRSTGKHWTIEISDHLPILFKLDLPEANHDA